MVSKSPRRNEKVTAADPRAKTVASRLPLPLSRALARFRAAEDDFEDACVELGSLFRIDDRYAVLVARATELLVHAGGRAEPVGDDEARLGAARAVANELRPLKPRRAGT